MPFILSFGNPLANLFYRILVEGFAMRLIKTFVLRFYTDTDHREQFCGEIQALPGKKSLPFKNITELLTHLNRLVSKKTTHNEENFLPHDQ